MILLFGLIETMALRTFKLTLLFTTYLLTWISLFCSYFACSFNLIFDSCHFFCLCPYFITYREFIRSTNWTSTGRTSWTFPPSLTTIRRFLPWFFNYWLLFVVFIASLHLAFNFNAFSFSLTVFILYFSTSARHSPDY